MPSQPRSSTPAALAAARQLIVVTTPDWDAVDGELQCYERATVDRPWQEVGPLVSIVVGRAGTAWGRGLHGEALGPGPVKREGDGRSPAGIFRLSSAFGYAGAREAGHLKLPYLEARPTLECVDDPSSRYYNTILDRQRVESPDWKSSEQMRRDDEQYRWGVVVDHNTNPPHAGGGSCIFLHIWAGPSQGTAGCTAMEAAQMERILRWLDPGLAPVLVQLPRAEHERLSRTWRLPR